MSWIFFHIANFICKVNFSQISCSLLQQSQSESLALCLFLLARIQIGEIDYIRDQRINIQDRFGKHPLIRYQYYQPVYRSAGMHTVSQCGGEFEMMVGFTSFRWLLSRQMYLSRAFKLQRHCTVGILVLWLPVTSICEQCCLVLQRICKNLHLVIQLMFQTRLSCFIQKSKQPTSSEYV